MLPPTRFTFFSLDPTKQQKHRTLGEWFLHGFGGFGASVSSSTSSSSFFGSFWNNELLSVERLESLEVEVEFPLSSWAYLFCLAACILIRHEYHYLM
ncbi:unnamed protein product [Rhizophagus irregularis]|nr:unnamed protein product [Rhizophagus irregularis]